MPGVYLAESANDIGRVGDVGLVVSEFVPDPFAGFRSVTPVDSSDIGAGFGQKLDDSLSYSARRTGDHDKFAVHCNCSVG
jgi:hypothetical protein